MLTNQSIDQHFATIAAELKKDAEVGEHAAIEAILAVAGSTLKAMHNIAHHLATLASS